MATHQDILKAQEKSGKARTTRMFGGNLNSRKIFMTECQSDQTTPNQKGVCCGLVMRQTRQTSWKAQMRWIPLWVSCGFLQVTSRLSHSLSSSPCQCYHLWKFWQHFRRTHSNNYWQTTEDHTPQENSALRCSIPSYSSQIGTGRDDRPRSMGLDEWRWAPLPSSLRDSVTRYCRRAKWGLCLWQQTESCHWWGTLVERNRWRWQTDRCQLGLSPVISLNHTSLAS